MSNLKLGKKPFVQDHRDLKFSSYFVAEKLPTIPDSFGHDSLIRDWGMLGNDQFGDCADAGAYHLSMLWWAMGGKSFSCTTKNAIDTYNKQTGRDVNDPTDDPGTNLRDLLKYWKNTGIEDVEGNIHKIAGFLSIDPKNMDHIKAAMYLFGGVYAGMLFPDSAMDQFQSGETWVVNPDDPEPNDGHCVPLVHCENVLTCITWGKEQSGTLSFWSKYLDEAWIVISEEMLIGGCTLEGFLWRDLLNDLNAFK